ncbi:aldo/keto reductase [Thermodesulfobacteriota bacterium]
MQLTEKKLLGRTGLQVSRIGLASGYGIPAAAVKKAFDAYGINLFFWRSRHCPEMGAALKDLIRTGRDRVVVSLQSYDHSGLFIPRMVHKRLRQLATDHIDILSLGWYNYFPKRVVKTALRLKQEGKIRFIALSGHNRKLFGRLARDPACPVDVFMFRYNAVHRGAEQDIFPFVPDRNPPGMTAYTALCWQQLLDPKNMPPGERPLTPAECYRFVLSSPHVDLCYSAPSTLAQMEAGLQALAQGPLSGEELARATLIGDYLYKRKR